MADNLPATNANVLQILQAGGINAFADWRDLSALLKETWVSRPGNGVVMGGPVLEHITFDHENFRVSRLIVHASFWDEVNRATQAGEVLESHRSATNREFQTESGAVLSAMENLRLFMADCWNPGYPSEEVRLQENGQLSAIVSEEMPLGSGPEHRAFAINVPMAQPGRDAPKVGFLLVTDCMAATTVTAFLMKPIDLPSVVSIHALQERETPPPPALAELHL